jgi:GT2 family glycosyltransferase
MSERESVAAVVVLNWNGAEDTIACLRSLRTSTVPLCVMVVDNGSTDDSLERIAASGLADEIIAAGANLGYAEGNNRGLRSALAGGYEVVVVLNNDTTVARDAIECLIDALPPGVPMAASPEIRYFNAPDESWFRGGVIDRGWPRHLQPAENGPLVSPGRPATGESPQVLPTPILTGCCIAARRETWQRVGLFDPAYFLIFEDSDWSLRASRSGTLMAVIPASRIFHRVSRSFDAAEVSLLGNFYFVRNGLRFQASYFGRHRARFVWQWLLLPGPAQLHAGQGRDALFRTLGAVTYACGQSGRAPRAVERLAMALSARRSITSTDGLMERNGDARR